MKLTKKMAISIPLSLMAIFLSSNCFAYTFTQDFNKGFYWKTFPIEVKKFVNKAEDGPLLEALANEALSEWEAAVGRELWTTIPVEQSVNYSGNYIRWSENFGVETGYDPKQTLAITVRYNQGTFFERTEIILNGGLSYLRQNWGNTLKITILHEIGHTLGLDHSNQEAVMAATLSKVTSLQDDDIQGMNALVDETLRRQSSGYKSPYLAQESSEKNKVVSACGSVEEVNSGPKNFIGASLLGILLAYIFRPRKRMVLVKY